MSRGENGALLAILLNPPMAREARETTSYKSVATAADVLGESGFLIVNLLQTATRDLPAISVEATDPELWLDSRSALEYRLREAGPVLAGWGMGGITGIASRHYRAQVNWLVEVLISQGRPEVWTIGGEPRHPSRWRQFTGPSRGHAVGGTFEERLRSVMTRVPVEALRGEARGRVQAPIRGLHDQGHAVGPMP